ncbi:uncharacterized protein [Watersipora subatra]
MESPDKAKALQSTRGKALKKVLLGTILVALALGLGMQVAHMFLAITTQHSPPVQQRDDQAPVVGRPMNDKWPQPATKVVIYSYLGMSSLPLGDLIGEVLSMHPQVLHISKANNVVTSSCSAFPSYNKKHVKHQVDSLMSCSPWLLSKSRKAGLLQHGNYKETSDCSQSRCEEAELRAITLYQSCGVTLENLYQWNDTLKFVHIAADPRLLSTVRWVTETGSKSMGLNRYYEERRNPEIKEVAQSYCDMLMGDINAMRTQQIHNGSQAGIASLSNRYFFRRLENFMMNPFSTMLDLFNFLDLHMTEEIENGLRLIKHINLQDLYIDAPSSTLSRQCREPIEMLGYPSSTEVKQGTPTLKSLVGKEWWKAGM